MTKTTTRATLGPARLTMSAAAGRRFHEAGLGSRTGLRIGSIRLDEQGNEDLDAFFAESKRVLEWMERSDDEASDGASSRGSVRGATPDDASAYDKRAPRLSEWAARSAPGAVTPRRRVADESLWDSTVDITRASRTFVLTEPDEGAGAPPAWVRAVGPRASAATERVADDTRWSATTLSPRVSRAPSVARSARTSSWLDAPSSVRSSSPPDASTPPLAPVPALETAAELTQWPDTDVPSFLRADASVVPRGELSLRRAPSASPAPSVPSAASLAAASPAPSVPSAASLAAPAWDEPASLTAPAWDEPATLSTLAPLEPDEPPPPAMPPPKRGRGRPRKDASMPPPRGRPGRPPGRQMPAQKIVERIYDPPSWQLEQPAGLRRGKRHRIAPLQWWRGERALYGKPDGPVGDEVTESGLVPAVLKEVIRVPRAPGEGTFSGMRRFRPKPVDAAAGGGEAVARPAGSARYDVRGDTDDDDDALSEASEAAVLAVPERGWDADTDPYGRVMDADQDMEVTMRTWRD